MRTTFQVGGIIDVHAVNARAIDPEAWLYQPGTKWFVVSSVQALETMGTWVTTESNVAVVAVEAIREKPYLTDWQRKARRVFFAPRAALGASGFVDGPVEGQRRYQLRDLIAVHDLNADGSTNK